MKIDLNKVIDIYNSDDIRSARPERNNTREIVCKFLRDIRTECLRKVESGDIDHVTQTHIGYNVTLTIDPVENSDIIIAGSEKINAVIYKMTNNGKNTIGDVIGEIDSGDIKYAILKLDMTGFVVRLSFRVDK